MLEQVTDFEHDLTELLKTKMAAEQVKEVYNYAPRNVKMPFILVEIKKINQIAGLFNDNIEVDFSVSLIGNINSKSKLIQQAELLEQLVTKADIYSLEYCQFNNIEIEAEPEIKIIKYKLNFETMLLKNLV